MGEASLDVAVGVTAAVLHKMGSLGAVEVAAVHRVAGVGLQDPYRAV